MRVEVKLERQKEQKARRSEGEKKEGQEWLVNVRLLELGYTENTQQTQLHQNRSTLFGGLMCKTQVLAM